MSIKTRATILSIRKEVTEGVPNLVSSSGDFVALQDGFSFAPETDTLENNELRNSLGSPKPRLGIERCNGSHDHYIRHSGVEGQAPNWGILLESLMGSVTEVATEYETVASSTTKLIKGNAGAGAALPRGTAILIKDPVNGRSIRNVSTTPTGDDLPLNFALANAPGTGVKLGKPVRYVPVSTGHASLTYDLFRGNDGAREVAAGMKIEEMNITVEAGQYISGSFTAKGTKYHFDAIEITTGRFLDFNDGTDDFSVSVPAKVYRDPHELAEALQDAMNDAGAADVYTVTYNDYGSLKGKFTIATDGATLILQWNTGANTANTIGVKLGYSVAADDTGTSLNSDSAQVWASPYSPAYDAADALVAKACEAFLGTVDDNLNICIRTMTIRIANTLQEKPCISSETGIDGVEVNAREATVEMVATLDKHSAREFKYYRKGSEVQFMFNFGEKSGGNWQAGFSCNVYFPTATVTSFALDDDNGDVVLNASLNAFVNSDGEEEIFANML